MTKDDSVKRIHDAARSSIVKTLRRLKSLSKENPEFKDELKGMDRSVNRMLKFEERLIQTDLENFFKSNSQNRPQNFSKTRHFMMEGVLHALLPVEWQSAQTTANAFSPTEIHSYKMLSVESFDSALTNVAKQFFSFNLLLVC